MSDAAKCPPAGRLFEREYIALKPCRHGLMLYNVNDTFIGRSLDLYGEWCEAEIELLRQVLRVGDCVIDVGANIGTHTLALARCVGDSGRVYALEPQRLAFQNLCANVALNALRNVWCLPLALGRTPGCMRAPNVDPTTAGNYGRLSLLGQHHGELIQAVPLDSLDVGPCHLIKVDVEGMEIAVLEGARRTILAYRPLLFVENNKVRGAPELLACLQSLGYSHCYWHIAGYYSPRNYFDNPENVFAACRPEANLLCAVEAVDLPGLVPVREGDTWQTAAARMQRVPR